MSNNIWILNHYATDMFENKTGRHFEFAKILSSRGYNPVIFCANTFHNSDKIIKIKNGKYRIEYSGKIPFVFVKTSRYKTNGYLRIRNMIRFYQNLLKVAKKYIKTHEKPDIILASSVHPLTMAAGIKIAEKLGIRCICEIRDLWPESIVDYMNISSKNILIKALYKLEKWVYKKADCLIFTMEGGRQYITEKGWDKEHGGPVDLKKVFHINNGVDLALFDYNKEHYKIDDKDLNNTQTFKVVYTGSIRKANNLEQIVECAELIKNKNIKFLIYGNGSDKEVLENECREKGIDNIIFKGKVDKKNIPYILSRGNLNILNYHDVHTWKYGGSQNKLFEYMASGKPILANIQIGYCLITRYQCGIAKRIKNARMYSQEINKIKCLPENEYKNMCINARKAAEDYDFKVLTEKLIEIIEKDKGIKSGKNLSYDKCTQQ